MFRLAALLFMAAILCPAQAQQCKRVVISGDADYPPYSWYDEFAFHGSAIEIVATALQRMGLAHEVRYVGPFKRMLNEARAGNVDIVAELKNLPERQEFLAFSKVPIFPNPVALFVRADRKFAYRRWDDLAGLKGGITLGNRFGGGFDEYLAQHLRIEEADRIKQNFDKLALGRIDYFVNSYYPAHSYLLRDGREAEFRLVQPFVTVSDNFVGWSKASPCLDKLAQFDEVLKAMVKSGEVKRIIDDGLAKMESLRKKP